MSSRYHRKGMKALRYLFRLTAMGIVLSWALGRYALGRLLLLRYPAGTARNKRHFALLGAILRQTLATLGATFVKLGQVLSTRPDLLPEELIAELRALQDRMPAFAFTIVRRTLEEELGAERLAEFSELDEVPVAAASVAQVHRGRLRDGTEVAIKVLRPSVRAEVDRDVAILLLFARVLALHPLLRLSDPVAHVEELAQGILEQTDLRHELAHYEHFRRNFAHVPKIVFPRTFPELCAERVLVMDFVRGTKLDALPPGDHVELASRIEHMLLKMCFEDGFVHADLHPGNMLLRESDGALCVFDVGLAKRVGPEIVEQFTDFARCLSTGTIEDFIGHFKRFHSYMAGEVDWVGFTRDVERFLAKVRSKSTGELELGPMFNEMYAIARTYQVRPLPQVVLVIVAVVTAEGIGKQLNPAGNIFVAASRILLPLLARRAAQGYNSLIPGAREAFEAARTANSNAGEAGATVIIMDSTEHRQAKA